VQSTPLLISFPLFLFFKKQKRGGMERRGEERRGGSNPLPRSRSYCGATPAYPAKQTLL